MFEDHVNNVLQTNKNKFNIIIPFANERVESAIALQNINNLFFLNIRARDNPINRIGSWLVESQFKRKTIFFNMHITFFGRKPDES